jgi:predicted dehydrogenase
LFRIGVIGCGRISKVYLSAFAAMGDTVRVCYCVDKRIERARAFAAHFEGWGIRTRRRTCLSSRWTSYTC